MGKAPDNKIKPIESKIHIQPANTADIYIKGRIVRDVFHWGVLDNRKGIKKRGLSPELGRNLSGIHAKFLIVIQFISRNNNNNVSLEIKCGIVLYNPRPRKS